MHAEPVKSFAENCLEELEGNTIPKSTVYQAYRDYCTKLKIKIVTLGTVSHKLPTFINTHGEILRIDGKPVRVWRNITIRGLTKGDGNTSCPISSLKGVCVDNDTLIKSTKESTKCNGAKDHAKDRAKDRAKDEDDKPESSLTEWLKSVKAIKESG